MSSESDALRGFTDLPPTNSRAAELMPRVSATAASSATRPTASTTTSKGAFRTRCIRWAVQKAYEASCPKQDRDGRLPLDWRLMEEKVLDNLPSGIATIARQRATQCGTRLRFGTDADGDAETHMPHSKERSTLKLTIEIGPYEPPVVGSNEDSEIDIFAFPAPSEEVMEFECTESPEYWNRKGAQRVHESLLPLSLRTAKRIMSSWHDETSEMPQIILSIFNKMNWCLFTDDPETGLVNTSVISNFSFKRGRTAVDLYLTSYDSHPPLADRDTLQDASAPETRAPLDGSRYGGSTSAS